MTSEEFVDALKEIIVEDGTRNLQTNLIKPPGRSPANELVQMSKWYNALSDGDKLMLLKIISDALHGGLFEVLCILDGVSSIENGEKGKLKLYYEKAGKSILLNDESKVMLHDLL